MSCRCDVAIIWILLVVVVLFHFGNCDEEKLVSSAVRYSQRSFIIYGKPTLLFSGSIHYTRVPPSDWNSVFQLAKVSLIIESMLQ
jgi:hypothetical protein